MINFVTLEHGLECQNAFAKVYLPSNTDAKKRHAISPSNMAKIKAECLSLDDDIRWLVAIIFDSSMRLSEAAGLMIDDLKLEEDIPYIDLKPHPHRRLKTASSERKIPLVVCRCGPQSALNSILQACIASLDKQTLSVVTPTLHQPQSTNGLRLLEGLMMLYMGCDIALEIGSEPLKHQQI